MEDTWGHKLILNLELDLSAQSTAAFSYFKTSWSDFPGKKVSNQAQRRMSPFLFFYFNLQNTKINGFCFVIVVSWLDYEGNLM